MTMASRRKPVTIDQPAKGKKNGHTGLPALPSDLIAELQKDATDSAANVKVFGDTNLISIKGGVFSFKGENLGKELDCVILAGANMNEYYAGAYDPNVKGTIPGCYALSETGKDMSPHAAATDKQNQTCDDCWAAKIGTASVGKGRACKQKVRIALMHGDDVTSAEAVTEALIAQVNVSAMSVGNYGAYVKVLAGDVNGKRPTYSVLTRITLEPHPTYQIVLKFSPLSGIGNAETLRAIMTRVRSEAKELVLAPYPAKKEDDNPGVKAKKKLPRQPAPAKVEAQRGGKSRFGR
jgi:hypothetical protein